MLRWLGEKEEHIYIPLGRLITNVRLILDLPLLRGIRVTEGESTILAMEVTRVAFVDHLVHGTSALSPVAVVTGGARRGACSGAWSSSGDRRSRTWGGSGIGIGIGSCGRGRGRGDGAVGMYYGRSSIDWLSIGGIGIGLGLGLGRGRRVGSGVDGG